MSGPLSDLHSARAGEYRVVYRVTSENVYIYGAGLRKEGDRDDIYEVIKRQYGLD